MAARRDTAALEKLKQRLDALVETYDARYLATDPLQFLHRYDDPDDREIVGLVASALAYGQVGQVLASVGRVMSFLGPRPARAVDRLDARRALRGLAGFKHRFNDGRDVVCLLEAARRARTRWGSLGGLLASGFRSEDRDVEGALAGFSGGMLQLMDGELYGRAGQVPASARFFFPSPPASACKRLNLYLRWMVRPRDGLDFGQWTGVPPRALVVPLDTHLARICGRLGLTRRRTAGWAMAREITDWLLRLDPVDPVRYDFAICRLGILDRCPPRRDPLLCAECALLDVCRHR
jgi:uncharacterized protein (TIGR02757 family)